MRARLTLFVVSVLLGACARSAPSAAPQGKNTHAGAPSGAPKAGGLTFAPFDKPAFERAAREGKLVLLDGAAEWCHWCHVMDAVTYHDGQVVAALEKGFVATRVDIDARPDIQERYADYGWPATIVFTADGRELGAYRGYLPPERMLAILEEARNARAGGAESSKVAVPREGGGELAASELAALEADVLTRMGAFYDDKEGGYGTFQKAPLGWNNAVLLRRASDPSLPEETRARERNRALFTLEKQAKLIDPVWGGIYQYSDGATWERPHYEKLMTFQAPALENYADAYALTKDPVQLSRARAMKGYLVGHLRRDDLFGATQDADLNAHTNDARKPFMAGQSFYALDDTKRRAAGEPRVEWRAYPKENGLAIAALARYADVTNDAYAKALALVTAKKMIASHMQKNGLAHEAGASAKVFHLADASHFGRGLVALYAVTKDPALLSAALVVRDGMMRTMWDEEHGGFFTHTHDADAIGVFQQRRMPLDENAFAVRFLVALARLPSSSRAWAFADEDATAMKKAVARTLFAVLTKENLDDRGRMLGEVALAIADARELFDAGRAQR